MSNGMVLHAGIVFVSNIYVHSIALMMFMTNMEIPVLITALVAITQDLGGFDDVSWVVSSYLLGYVCMSKSIQFRPYSKLTPRGSCHCYLRQVQ